jgi:RNA polymerase sigma-70 factor (ECF subfamily)
MFVNEIKRSSKSPQLMPDFDLLMSYTVYEDPAETERERINIRADIEKGLATLPEKYREVLVLRYYEDMEYKDIADVLQIPLGTVSVRIQRAKQALEKQYKQTIL